MVTVIQDKISIGSQWLVTEVEIIDFVARTLSPPTPKRSQALRHLVALGFPVFIENLKKNGMQVVSPPPSLAEPHPEEVSVSRGSDLDKG